MKQPLYIHAASAISPQQSFHPEGFLNPIITSNNCRLFALETAYEQYISPVAIRRMSRIMKMTISAAMQCLKEANITTPDAIITGTGRGGVTDMELFVKDMIRLDEGALNPTAFIQSTYNSPNGWIAMQSKCTGYNQTYVHRGCSFELALLDAQMLLAEASVRQNILVGCYDELTEDYFIIRSKRGYWKTEPLQSGELLRHANTTGSIAGEGAMFLLITNEPKGALACIEAMQIVHNATHTNVSQAVNNIMDEACTTMAELSLVLVGLNGDLVQSNLYYDVLPIFPKALPIGAFKHLCGEYDTSLGFAVWLATYLFKSEKIPNSMLLPKAYNVDTSPDKILIINHFILGSASVTLIKRHKQ